MKGQLHISTLAAALLAVISFSASAVYPGQNDGIENNFSGNARGCQISDNTTNTGPYIGGSAGSASDGSFACGYGNSATGQNATAFGIGNTATGINAIAVGSFSNATASNSMALGREASATATGSVAIGAYSVADAGNTVSIGSETVQRRLVNLAPGINQTDGVNMSQIQSMVRYTGSEELFLDNWEGNSVRIRNLKAGVDPLDAVNVEQLNYMGNTFVSWIGGGSSFAGGVFTGPTFNVQGGSYFNVGTAFEAIDTALTNINVRIDGLGAGVPGADGKSAYQSALDGGFVGSETEWVASLQGTNGTNGTNGIDGQNGQDGAPGRDGIDGRDGVDGRDGAPGRDGIDGRDGVDGRDGQDGAPGRDGIDGQDGAAGRDGVDGQNGQDGIGNDGKDGRDAYQIAVEDGGFQGDRQAWLASLRGQDGRDAPGGGGDGNDLAVEYTDESRTEVTLGVQGAVRVANVAAGTVATDAVNVSQLREQAEQTVRIANSYTDQQIGRLEQSWQGRWDNLDGRIREVDRRVDRVGASSAALTMMASSGTHLEAGQVAAQAGFGMYRSTSAFAAGLKGRMSERASISIGGSFDGESAMGGVGISWTLR